MIKELERIEELTDELNDMLNREPRCKECFCNVEDCNFESKYSDDRCPGYLIRQSEKIGEESFESNYQNSHV